MKKATKIIAAVGAVLIAGYAGLMCFGGQLFYRKAEKEFTDYFLEWNPEPWQFADKGTVPDGEQLTLNGVSLTVPKGLAQSPDEPRAYKTEPDAEGGQRLVICMAPEEWGDFTFDDMNPLIGKRVETYLHSVGQEMPHTQGDLHRLLFTLKKEDGNTRNFIDAGIFYKLEKLKTEMIFPGNVHYLIDNPAATGIAGVVKPHEDTVTGYRIYLDVFDPNDKDRSNLIVLGAPDFDTVCQMANSVVLVPYEASEIIQ